MVLGLLIWIAMFLWVWGYFVAYLCAWVRLFDRLLDAIVCLVLEFYCVFDGLCLYWLRLDCWCYYYWLCCFIVAALSYNLFV